MCRLFFFLIFFDSKKWGSLDLFSRYKHLKLKLRVFLTGYTIAMVTCNVKKIIITCSPVIEHLFETIILMGQLLMTRSIDPSKLRC